MSGEAASDGALGAGNYLGQTSLLLESGPDALKRLQPFLERFAAMSSLPPETARAIDLALTEWITNIISHGFAEGEPGTIGVTFFLNRTGIQIEVEDTGRSFNPLERPDVDIARPLAEKPMGGLGIHILRQVMDKLNYVRVNGRNRLTMSKRFSAGKS